MSLWRRTPVARPTARAAASPASKAATRPGGSAPGGGLLAGLGWLVIFAVLVVVLVVVPIAAWIKTGEPIAVIAPWAAAAFCWWSECREQRLWLKRHGKPPVENYPAGAAFRRRWDTAESCSEVEKTQPVTAWARLSEWTSRVWRPKVEAAPAPAAEPVPCYVVHELPGADGVYGTHAYTLVDAFMDVQAEADRLGLTGEQRVEAMVAALRGAKPASRSKQPVGRGGDGGGTTQSAIEARADKMRWLSRSEWGD